MQISFLTNIMEKKYNKASSLEESGNIIFSIQPELLQTPTSLERHNVDNITEKRVLECKYDLGKTMAKNFEDCGISPFENVKDKRPCNFRFFFNLFDAIIKYFVVFKDLGFQPLFGQLPQFSIENKILENYKDIISYNISLCSPIKFRSSEVIDFIHIFNEKYNLHNMLNDVFIFGIIEWVTNNILEELVKIGEEIEKGYTTIAEEKSVLEKSMNNLYSIINREGLVTRFWYEKDLGFYQKMSKLTKNLEKSLGL